MNDLKTTYVPWLVFLFAVLTWGIVVFVALSVSGAETHRATEETTVEQEKVRLASTLRLHALARETKEARVALEKLSRTDAVSIVETIESIGEYTDAAIKIAQVVVEPPKPTASPDAPAIRPVVVTLDVQGTFAELMHTAALLYSLPLPSSVTQMRFELLPESSSQSGNTWRLVMRVQVLTTAEISS